MTAAALVACARRAPALRLGTTTTVAASGVLDSILDLWHGARVGVVIAPSGQILTSAAAGDLDLALTHAPDLERRILWPRAEWRCPFVASRFAVVGPAADPADVARAANAVDAFRRIAVARAPFVSRGDSSGTNVKELALWRAAGVHAAHQGWYVESGADQATTLRLAQTRSAYALADLPTLAAVRDVTLRVLFADDTLLQNPYTLYVVRGPDDAAARAFATWVMDSARARIAALRLPDGRPAFTPRVGGCTPPDTTSQKGGL